jgi:hypothetical protein
MALPLTVPSPRIGADFGPMLAPPPMPEAFDLIWSLAIAYAALTRLERVSTAKSLQDDVLSICECWYGEIATDGATDEARQGFVSDLRMLLAWAERTIRTIESEQMEQLTAARAAAAVMALDVDPECGF